MEQPTQPGFFPLLAKPNSGYRSEKTGKCRLKGELVIKSLPYYCITSDLFQTRQVGRRRVYELARVAGVGDELFGPP